MRLLNLTESHPYLSAFKQLYTDAFPADEKKPVGMLFLLQSKGVADIFALDDSGFCGLAVALKGSAAVIVDYLAVSSDMRGRGCGSHALRLLREKYGDKLIFEIEAAVPNAENAAQRKKRRDFYLKNGLLPTEIFVNVYNTDMELLSFSPLNCEEYLSVLKEAGDDLYKTANPKLLPRLY